MIRRHTVLPLLAAIGLVACTTTTEHGTLAELQQVQADITEVPLGDSLEQAAQSYRRYLEETEENELTPEAMRRLADLQLEQEYGVIGEAQATALSAPVSATRATPATNETKRSTAPEPSESDLELEERAAQRQEFLAEATDTPDLLPEGEADPIPAGPREAIATYRNILETYPHYERNDQVLYQMSRAYDEIGEPDESMAVMNRLVAEYPYSKYLDEVNFRRGEYYFVRKKYLDAEDAYAATIRRGTTSPYYELALYKQGWTFYKQEMYEEALNNYITTLDYRLSIGYDFDSVDSENDEQRVTDTFRVISLSFSNMGGPDVVDDYFSIHGHRNYADKIYGNLGEFYLGKRRYNDAAAIYDSFIELNPFHKVSPYFGMRIIEVYGEGGFPQLVVESKKRFATNYALDAAYWEYFDVNESPEVTGFLKSNLTDLANHYHALYQERVFANEQPANFQEAQHWYRQFLGSFPADETAPQINYQLADLLLENKNFGEAAAEYERTAYDYAAHEQASAAGYAAIYSHREHLKVATGALRHEVRRTTVASSLRFADAFQEHEQAPKVLGAAADDLYEMQDFPVAIESAHILIDRYPDTDRTLLRSAWAVIAHSSIDLAEYADAEHAYARVLELTPADDESRGAIIDGLAAAIYKQGEQANLLEDYRTAANHFLRIQEVAPGSNIRATAEYDAAAALIRLQDWSMASGVLEAFRTDHPDHELRTEATKQLAFIYREDGQIERSAIEYERIAAESTDPELRREALLMAGDLYDEARVISETIRVYERYVAEYPRPLDHAVETRSRLAEIFKSENDEERYQKELLAIIAIDRDSGRERTDRSRYLAAKAALVLAEQSYEQFAALRLQQPFEQSLAEKQRLMNVTKSDFERLASYEVAEVTAAAIYYTAEIYFGFSTALMESERPADLSETEKITYELVIEEEAYPFEELAIEVHEKNSELLAVGIYNPWVQKSLDELALLMPGRYAKNEISGGFVGSIDTYAYRMPIAPEPGVEGRDDVEISDARDTSASMEMTAGISPTINDSQR